jgi:hypothetical protein
MPRLELQPCHENCQEVCPRTQGTLPHHYTRPHQQLCPHQQSCPCHHPFKGNWGLPWDIGNQCTVCFPIE